MKKVFYYVNSGVDYYHRTMNAVQFELLRDAKAYYKQLPNDYNNAYKELIRFDDTEKTVILNTQIEADLLFAKRRQEFLKLQAQKEGRIKCN